MLDRRTGLYWLNLQRGTNVREHAGTKGQRLGVVLLPSLVLGAEIEGTGVLQVWGENDGLVAGFAGELDSKIPGIEGHKREVEILRYQMLRSKCIEAVDCVPKSACIANMFPGERRQAGAERCNRRIDGLDEDALSV
jgi:hypothetical protein